MPPLSDEQAPNGLWTRFTDEIGGWPTPVKIAVGIVVTILAISAINKIFGLNDSSSKSSVSKVPSKTHQAPPSPLAARHQQALEFRESIAGSIDHDDSPTIRCAGQSHCGVTYEVEELAGFDTEEELVFDQRDVWATLFANPRFRGGFIELEGPVESIGGKVSVEPLLVVRCDRAADNQIDWENVTAEGLKQLCQWEPEVNLE